MVDPYYDAFRFLTPYLREFAGSEDIDKDYGSEPANKLNGKKNEKREDKSPLDLVKDGDLCVFSINEKIVYTVFLNDQFLYVERRNSYETLYEKDLVAIYAYPTSKLNELFWDQRPSDEVISNKKNLIWSRKNDDSEYKKKLNDIDNAMKKLQEYKKKILDQKNGKGHKLNTSGFDL